MRHTKPGNVKAENDDLSVDSICREERTALNGRLREGNRHEGATVLYHKV
jgi:hypothetical protein